MAKLQTSKNAFSNEIAMNSEPVNDFEEEAIVESFTNVEFDDLGDKKKK
jgi:hypothetical protein